MKDKHPLYLIDSYGLIYRSYFAFISRPLRNAQGKNVSAVFGFFRNVVALLDQGAPAADGTIRRPQRLAAVFDSRVPTFRHELYPDYKANRQKTPEELHEQVPVVEEVLAALGVPVLRADGFEADDLIAALALRCKARAGNAISFRLTRICSNWWGTACTPSNRAKAVQPRESPSARTTNSWAPPR
jgi:DNA polymerase-1